MYLAGAKDLKLDAKARLTLPADFRKEFDAQVRLIPMPEAIYGFTPEGFAAWMEGIFNREYKASHPNWRRTQLALNGRCQMVEIDSAGRIALGKVDEQARKNLGIDREVVVVGSGERFEIWNSDAWKELNASVTDEDLTEVMSSLDF